MANYYLDKEMRATALIKKFFKALAFTVLFIMFLLLVNAKSVHASEISSTKCEYTLLNEINNLRKAQGEKPLVLDKNLTAIAAVRSKECAVKWSHTRPNGTQGLDAIPGNVWKGENLSYVEGTASNEAASIMFTDLVNSPTHYDNMVFSEFTRVGIKAYEASDGCVYVAYMFAS